MKQPDVIIIGAGAAGLMAAYTLVKSGKTVTVLEARRRLGGRIHTVKQEFSAPVELGAEFVHGNLPVTLGLLKEAGIATTGVNFEMWQHHGDVLKQSEEFIEGFGDFLGKLNDLQEDMPMQEFLEQHFPGEEYAKMRRQIADYVSGYDTANIMDASAFALRNEWNHEDEDAQHRVVGDYTTMAEYLAKVCRDAGSQIVTESVVKRIEWERGRVKVCCLNSDIYESEKLIIALPLGVLQAPIGAEGGIQFSPVLQQGAAFQNIGFGAVIKVLLEFESMFWEENIFEADLSTMGFLFSDEAIPTYWTQSPQRSPLLTGWLGGPPAFDQKDAPAETILEMALESLGNIFNITVEVLKDKLVAWDVVNWTAEPYTRGSYAYDKIESPEARKTLQLPVEDTLYFAGEYLYNGPAMGTVEAALTSGRDVAQTLLKG